MDHHLSYDLIWHVGTSHYITRWTAHIFFGGGEKRKKLEVNLEATLPEINNAQLTKLRMKHSVYSILSTCQRQVLIPVSWGYLNRKHFFQPLISGDILGLQMAVQTVQETIIITLLSNENITLVGWVIYGIIVPNLNIYYIYIKGILINLW